MSVAVHVFVGVADVLPRRRVVVHGVAMGRVFDVIRPNGRMNEGLLGLLVVIRHPGDPTRIVVVQLDQGIDLGFRLQVSFE